MRPDQPSFFCPTDYNRTTILLLLTVSTQSRGGARSSQEKFGFRRCVGSVGGMVAALASWVVDCGSQGGGFAWRARLGDGATRRACALRVRCPRRGRPGRVDNHGTGRARWSDRQKRSSPGNKAHFDARKVDPTVDARSTNWLQLFPPQTLGLRVRHAWSRDPATVVSGYLAGL